MDKVRLREILRTFYGDYNDLYGRVNTVPGKNVGFDSYYYNEIVYYCLYLFHNAHGIDKLSAKGSIPRLFGDVSYDEFKILLNRYKAIPFHNEIIQEETNVYQVIMRLAAAKLLSRDSWTKVYSSVLQGTDFNEKGKIYVSVDNKDLYQFSCLFLSKCLKRGINDFEFKLNNDAEMNRTDNVVIYFTEENFSSYMDVIHEVFSLFPEMKINHGHILGYGLEDGVSIAKDYKDGSSYTEKVCKAILALKQNGYSDDKIIDLIDVNTRSHLEEVIQMVDEGVRRTK